VKSYFEKLQHLIAVATGSFIIKVSSPNKLPLLYKFSFDEKLFWEIITPHRRSKR
jgi:hypothetical protein